MFQEGLYSFLTASAEITAIVGTPAERSARSAGRDPTTGIFSAQMPEAALFPAIVFKEIVGEGIVTMEGASALRSTRQQFSCYARSFSQAKLLAEALRSVFEGLQATLPDGTEVDVATVRPMDDGFEEAPFLYHKPVEIEFWFREPAAIQAG